ncbi:amino acid transporter [Paenibacillus popilliae ATCC 14706]|uniref:Amino acid transporter n=1 Tax=Paenibacillus popilliae ATCC 14706 TaxID=1212764 RepID=M9LKE2_PAEPP|nr:amino acid transporter [Paenibacillus popilliae ATCC 14706]
MDWEGFYWKTSNYFISNGMTFRNINKAKAGKKAEKRLRRLQRQVSRKYEMNKEGTVLSKHATL